MRQTDDVLLFVYSIYTFFGRVDETFSNGSYFPRVPGPTLFANIATGLSELDSSTRVRSALVNVLNEGEHALGSTNQRRRWCGQI